MATPAKKGAAVWTEAEKYQFLLKIIGQVGGGSLTSVHPKFDAIDLNGRTAKALSLMWLKIKDEAKKAGAADGEGTTDKAPPSTPRKRKANGIGNGTPNSKKRTPASNKKGKSKKYVSDDSEPEEEPDLGPSEEDVSTKEEPKEMDEFTKEEEVVAKAL